MIEYKESHDTDDEYGFECHFSEQLFWANKYILMIFWEDGSEVVIIDPDEEDDLEMEGIPYV